VGVVVAEVCDADPDPDPDPDAVVVVDFDPSPTSAVSLESSVKEALTLVAFTQAEGFSPVPWTKLTTAH
jgi:hypothetical protein